MPAYRSHRTTQGRTQAAARALWRATGTAAADMAHACSADGGLAVLHGNPAADGCIVKTAGVDESILKFTGRAVVFESQDDAVEGILGGRLAAGDVVVIRYEGPRGGPGMQEMLTPTSLLKAVGLARDCALIEPGDGITIDIPARRIHLEVADDELARRRAAMNSRADGGRRPAKRTRPVSRALQAYGALARSASFGAVRDPAALGLPRTAG